MCNLSRGALHVYGHFYSFVLYNTPLKCLRYSLDKHRFMAVTLRAFSRALEWNKLAQCDLLVLM